MMCNGQRLACVNNFLIIFKVTPTLRQALGISQNTYKTQEVFCTSGVRLSMAIITITNNKKYIEVKLASSWQQLTQITDVL